MQFKDVKALIDEHNNLADFVGGVSEAEIKNAEHRLGVELPTSYWEFLRHYGCGNFGAQEIFGLGVPDTGIPNVVWCTEVTRRDDPKFPTSYIVVYDAGLGEILCLATDRLDAAHECPVVSWIPGSPQQNLEEVATTFADLLGSLVLSETRM